MQVANKPAITIPGAGGPAGRHVPPALLGSPCAPPGACSRLPGREASGFTVRARASRPTSHLPEQGRHDFGGGLQ